jgi:thioredoxin-like negative regulator of GroEL
MKPVVDRLTQEFSGKVEVRRLNVGGGDPAAEQVANQYQVQYVPTFVLLNSDGSKADLVVGSLAEDALRTKMAGLR